MFKALVDSGYGSMLVICILLGIVVAMMMSGRPRS